MISEPSQNKHREHKEPTYVEEQESLKNSLKAVLNSDSEDDEENWGGLFKKREKTYKDKVRIIIIQQSIPSYLGRSQAEHDNHK